MTRQTGEDEDCDTMVGGKPVSLSGLVIKLKVQHHEVVKMYNPNLQPLTNLLLTTRTVKHLCVLKNK